MEHIKHQRDGAWERFMKTGEIGAYLVYCAMREREQFKGE